ncbi:Uncharacterized protein PCOAH_00041980 [Plasmodium coatneyi]|uniref:Uncharacterized protein n=1 Tax=Plasmodium coatneyi TaxID=208452 RepID=A0A1B1E5K7_9APIC|nr:Uncharacterized protein PCOAH_00041980 [Plasmodium coatneyi]ANQ10296.1 Uncharacterized protein PCOAH_00041980 [Plasmodium coatneyi]
MEKQADVVHACVGEQERVLPKKKYSNLVKISKQQIEGHENKNDLLSEKKEERRALELFPMMMEETPSLELKKLREGISNFEDGADDVMMSLCMSKTPCKRYDDDIICEGTKYVKTYSSKKRVYTPRKVKNKGNLFQLENEERDNKASLFVTPRRKYTNKRKINELLKDLHSDQVANRSVTKRKKKKKSVYDELVYLYTPRRERSKFVTTGMDSASITKLADSSNLVDLTNVAAAADKWQMQESNMQELPDNIKNEYISYLCSPLKRSERLIKSRINKMLNENIGQEKQVNSDETERDMNSNNTTCYTSSYSGISRSECIHCDFEPEEEEKCWDDYYTQGNDKVRPFTGITTELAVDMITELLKGKIRKIVIDEKEYFSPITENDTIMEVGHGNHPLAVQMHEKWGTVGRYIGVEFSGLASREALKCEKLKNLFLRRKVEFVKILSMKYFKGDYLNGLVVQSNISPCNTKADFVKMNSFKYIFAKSTLDYITCRMDNIGNSGDWEEDLQISPSVVDMFDSLADSLQNCKNSSNRCNSCIIFVEPSNSSKFRDHILTIFKAIYTATFKYSSAAKFLRLSKITNNQKACGYMIEKRNEVYRDFEEIRQDFLKLIIKASVTKNVDEVDWYLPSEAPKKWVSNNPADIEYLVKLDCHSF